MKHDIENLRHAKAGVPVQQYVYRNVEGNPVLIANRFEKGNGEKFFLPYDMLRKAWKAPDMRPIYNLHLVAAASADTPIICVEGEKCADALAELGYLATTTFGGCNGSSKSDLSPLEGRTIIIWPDFDDPGQKYAKLVADTLRNRHACKVATIAISNDTLRSASGEAENPSYALRKGWDAADAIGEGWDKVAIDRLISLAVPHGDIPKTEQPDTEASLGIVDLWHTPNREPYVTIQTDNHFEHLSLESSHFKSLLSHAHYKAEGKVLTSNALEDKRRAMVGQALFDGERFKIFNRVGSQGKTVYLDLGDPDWRAVAIDATGWQIVTNPPVHFTRARSMLALPIPEMGGGDINMLRPFLNTGSETDFKMIVAWLIGCFHPKGPYPILILTGEQGSAKSTTAKVLRSLIDPANPMGRSSPQNEQDLVIAAKHNHVLAFDNLSNIKPAIADALCRISTGGGFGTRKLYTDSEEILFDATRPCILNGIPDLATRPDLADRSIVVTLPIIPSSARQTDAEFWRGFKSAAPLILAGLLDAISTALDRIGNVKLAETPRMADFAKWTTAAEPALGWANGAFMEAYAVNKLSAEDAAIEGNPVAEAILCLMDEKEGWQGTATELLKTLRMTYPELAGDPASFPRQPNLFSGELRRVQALLRSRGIKIVFVRQGKSGYRRIEIRKAEE